MQALMLCAVLDPCNTIWHLRSYIWNNNVLRHGLTRACWRIFKHRRDNGCQLLLICYRHRKKRWEFCLHLYKADLVQLGLSFASAAGGKSTYSIRQAPTSATTSSGSNPRTIACVKLNAYPYFLTGRSRSARLIRGCAHLIFQWTQ